MFNKKLTIIAGVGIFIFILGFGLISGVYTDNPVNDDGEENVKCLIPVKTVTMKHNSGDASSNNLNKNPVTNSDSEELDDDCDDEDLDDDCDDEDLDDDCDDESEGEDDEDELDDDCDDEDGFDDDELDDDCDDEDGFDDDELDDDCDDRSSKGTKTVSKVVYKTIYKNVSKDSLDNKRDPDFDKSSSSHPDLINNEENSNYYEFEWNGNIYNINLDQFNLTDEELTELLTKRNLSMEEIDNLEALIQKMGLSRSDDILLAIDNLFDSMGSIVDNADFNDLLLSLKDININLLSSTFNDLKIMLESIKSEYLDEDFSEVDYLMDNLETLLNKELERYGNLSSQLTEELADLFEFFDKYPFLRDHTKYNNSDSPNYYEFEWNGNIYHIDLDQFNLTDEELRDLFAKRDALMEEIDNLEALIQKMGLSRSDDILLAIDNLFDSMGSIVDNADFNDLLLSLKDININLLSSTFNDLKIMLESIKADYPDEDFSEVDYLMDNLETLLNEELGRYGNLTLELKEKLDELFELFEKYPFLRQHTKYTLTISNTSFAEKGHMSRVYSADDVGSQDKNYNVLESDSKCFNTVLAGMKNTGIPYLSVAILALIIGLFGFGIRRKF